MGESGSLVSQTSGKISHAFFFPLKKEKNKTKRKRKEQLSLLPPPKKHKHNSLCQMHYIYC